MPNPPYDDSADDALILRLQRGDTSACEPLIDRHLHHVRLFGALKAPVPKAVEDFARDTFVVAFQNIADFSVGMSFRTWLRAIIWDLIRTDIQRDSSAAAKTSRFAQQRLAEMDRETVSLYEADEVECFQACLEEIPAPLMEILRLKYRRGRTNEEIAVHTRRSLATVRSVLFRVRQQLSHCIDRKSGRPVDAE